MSSSDGGSSSGEPAQCMLEQCSAPRGCTYLSPICGRDGAFSCGELDCSHNLSPSCTADCPVPSDGCAPTPTGCAEQGNLDCSTEECAPDTQIIGDPPPAQAANCGTGNFVCQRCNQYCPNQNHVCCVYSHQYCCRGDGSFIKWIAVE